MKGKIIVIEGTECSGKATQTQLLATRLRREGRKVELMSFPMYDTPTGKIVGGPYLGKENIEESWFLEGATNVDPKVAALYYAADRRYNLKLINEYLEQGYDLILDRYVESNMAHQGCKLSNSEERKELYKWLETLEYDLLELPKPDLTILLHMPVKKVLELKRGRTNKEQHELSIVYLKNSEEAYLELAKMKNYNVISCVDKDKLKDVLNIHEEVYNIVNGVLN